MQKIKLKKKDWDELNTQCGLCEKDLTDNSSKKKVIIIPDNIRICDKCYDDKEYLSED